MSDLPSAFFIQVSAASVSEPPADGNREVDHGGDAAARAGARAGAVVVGRHGAAERQLEVHVHVEHAGDHVVAASRR